MRIREDYPIYLDPSDEELIQLAESGWDTLRVMEGPEVFAIGSGFGNTHDSIIYYYAMSKGFKREKALYGYKWGGRWPDWDPFIFFHERSGIMLCNLEDVSGSRRAMPSEWKDYLSSDERVRQMCLVAEFSGLRHD